MNKPWRIVLALLGFFACVFGVGLGVQQATQGLPKTVAVVLSGLGMSAAALGLVALLRRFVDRKPLADIGLKFGRTTLPELLGGIVLALAVTAAAAVTIVWTGHGIWANKAPDLGIAELIVFAAASTLLAQGFPEELVFRGYVFGNLRPGWVAVTTSSIIFGSLHVLSNSGATTLTERLLFAVMAVGYGLMLAACRTISGAIWLGTGFHAGHNTFTRTIVFVDQDSFVPALMITLGSLVAAAAITFAAHHLWSARRRSATPPPALRTAVPRPE